MRLVQARLAAMVLDQQFEDGQELALEVFLLSISVEEAQEIVLDQLEAPFLDAAQNKTRIILLLLQMLQLLQLLITGAAKTRPRIANIQPPKVRATRTLRPRPQTALILLRNYVLFQILYFSFNAVQRLLQNLYEVADQDGVGADLVTFVTSFGVRPLPESLVHSVGRCVVHRIVHRVIRLGVLLRCQLIQVVRREDGVVLVDLVLVRQGGLVLKAGLGDGEVVQGETVLVEARHVGLLATPENIIIEF